MVPGPRGRACRARYAYRSHSRSPRWDWAYHSPCTLMPISARRRSLTGRGRSGEEIGHARMRPGLRRATRKECHTGVRRSKSGWVSWSQITSGSWPVNRPVRRVWSDGRDGSFVRQRNPGDGSARVHPARFDVSCRTHLVLQRRRPGQQTRWPGLTTYYWLQLGHLRILVTEPAPTVRPPSRIAKRRPSSMAIGWISLTVMPVVSPGMTISVPSGSVTTPVTSVVRK
ncbi:MAG: hypothetical protein QOF58_6771 [Pseudonocardiales bacterium]|nr:hypothetical protein [Pseudonocardiales bacterium]